VPLPRKAWVELVWESRLSPEEDGFNILTIDGREALALPGMNMPNAERFAAEFAAAGIDFELQQPLAYERFQSGATSNPTNADVELFVDDMRLEILD